MIEESISELSNVLEKKPYSKIAWHQLGKVYKKQRKFKESISAFDFAIISDDQFVSAYIEKAKILEKIKKYYEALENYKISIQLSEPNSYILFRISKCYQKLGNKKFFLDYIKKSLREEPSNEKAWIYLINFYLDKNNMRQTIYLANKALENNHNSIKIIELNAKISNLMGNYNEAINYFKEIIEFKEKQSWRIWKNLIKCLIKNKDWDQSLKFSLKAKKYFPKKSFLDYIISGCLLKDGKINEAIYFYQSGKKISNIPSKLLDSFPELKDNASLLV